MNRRRYLRGAGVAGAVALAGCVGDLLGGDEGDPFPSILTNRVTESPLSDVRFDVTVNRRFEPEWPALVRGRFTNTAERERRFLFEGTPPVGRSVSEGDALVLVPNTGASADLVPDAPTDDCWVATAVPETDGTDEVTLSAGESLVTDYAVLSPPEDECLPVGRHRFSWPVRLVADDGEREGEGEAGFTVEVDDCC